MQAKNHSIARYAAIALMALLPVIASAVEYKNIYRGQQQYASHMMTVTAPEVSFQSTSSLAGSGSTLSSTPMLNEDGTATYEGETSSGAPRGPHRIAPPKPSGDPTPLGDVLIPLLLMAMAYATSILLRRRKTH